MRALRRFVVRLAASAMKRRDEERLREEVEEHLAQQTADNIRAGLSPVEARRQAALKFGAVEAIKEDYRDAQGLPFLESLWQDVRYALRQLRKAPSFTVTATLTLALGIGATTSIFTLVEAVLLRTLPVAEPGQLYRVGKDSHCCVRLGFSQSGEVGLVSHELYEYLRENTRDFEQLSAFQAGGTFLGVRRAQSTNVAEIHFGQFVSGNYFSMFGVSAYAGRTLSMADDRPGAPPVAVISYRLWEQDYGRNPSVIGGAFTINGKPFTVVGVTPPSFYGGRLSSTPPDVHLPLATEPLVKGDSSLLDKADTHWLHVIGRLRPGTNVAATQAQMRTTLLQWLRSHSADMSANERLQLPKQTLNLAPGGAGITTMRQQYAHWLQILMMTSGFVLLIVCANVANLLLLRGMERRQQISLSMALGARRMRLIRQALTESLVLSLLGGIAGLAVAFVGTRTLLYFAFQTVTEVPISAAPSGPVLLFAFGVSLITGVTFGIAPAWVATHVHPIEALRGASRSTRAAASRPRQAMVVLQTALSVVLLSVSGLLLHTLRNLENQDFGFKQHGRTVINIDPLLAGYKPEQLELLYDRIHDSLADIPGVASVASSLYSPLSGDDWGEAVYVQGRPQPGPNTDIGAGWSRVSSGFFETIGNPIVKGRPIAEEDTARSRHVAVVNEAFARKFFKNEDPIGRHFGKGGTEYSGDYAIVGVAKDARYVGHGLDKPVGAFFFVPQSQSTQYTQPMAASTELRSHYLRDVVVQMRSGTMVSEEVVRRALASVDPNLPIRRIRSMEQQVAGTFDQQRLIARLTSLFGILALVLASIGVYGVISYDIRRRTNEIGVRMALGADRGGVLALILRGAGVLIAFGLLLGLPMTWAAGRFLGSQLYGLDQRDPVVISIAVFTLALSAVIAALIPAFRASSISPLDALRSQ